MKIVDVLRKLADTIDQYGGDQAQPDEKIVNPANMIAVDTGDDCGCDDGEEAEQPDDIMVPPMQLKLELLKKAVGVENIYDDGDNGTDGMDSDDDLARMKQLAAITNASDDEPLDD